MPYLIKKFKIIIKEFIKFKFIEYYYVLLKKTVSFEIQGLESLQKKEGLGFVPVFLSAHTVLLPSLLSHKPITVLVSQSQDGELISRILQKQGFGVLRGSSHKGAVYGLKKLMEAAKRKEALGIAFDGPTGPPLNPKKGFLMCLKYSWMFPVFVKITPLNFLSITLKSWDRFQLPLPFCRYKVTYQDLSDQEHVYQTLKTLAHINYGHLYHE